MLINRASVVLLGGPGCPAMRILKVAWFQSRDHIMAHPVVVMPQRSTIVTGAGLPEPLSRCVLTRTLLCVPVTGADNSSRGHVQSFGGILRTDRIREASGFVRHVPGPIVCALQVASLQQLGQRRWVVRINFHERLQHHSFQST